LEQETVFKDVVEQVADGNHSICGVILESHLLGGKQSFHSLPVNPEISITDPCLDWNQTVKLLQEGAHMLKERSASAIRNAVTCVI
jgi:3-deoxy-7-phosphoheptulonate synthase